VPILVLTAFEFDEFVFEALRGLPDTLPGRPGRS
jgi:hypothetical protein